MIDCPGQPWSPADVRDLLASGLSRQQGRPLRIRSVRSRALDGYSSHPIWRLEVTLAHGSVVRAICKRFRPDRAKDVGREARLYQRLLAHHPIGAPRLYGARCDEKAGHYWLLLEDVGDRRLDTCAAPDWTPAFTWMARLHAAYADRTAELRDLDCLEEHDRRFWLLLAAGARRSLRRHRPDALRRFDALTDTWLEAAIAALARQPRTLVHGDLSCHNVMVDADRRVRPIDWEWAAIGVGAWDVAKLLAGWGSRRAAFVGAYLYELDRCSAAPVDREAFAAAQVQCQAMHRLWYLRWWIDACGDPAYVDRLLGKLERDWRQLDLVPSRTAGAARR